MHLEVRFMDMLEALIAARQLDAVFMLAFLLLYYL